MLSFQLVSGKATQAGLTVYMMYCMAKVQNITQLCSLSCKVCPSLISVLINIIPCLCMCLYTGCLSALVYQHSITPLALPCKLVIPTKGKTLSYVLMSVCVCVFKMISVLLIASVRVIYSLCAGVNTSEVNLEPLQLVLSVCQLLHAMQVWGERRAKGSMLLFSLKQHVSTQQSVNSQQKGRNHGSYLTTSI